MHEHSRSHSPARCYAACGLGAAGGEVDLGPEESRHLRTVLRARGGERVVLFDGRGGEAEAELLPGPGRGLRARVLGVAFRAPPAPRVRLFQAIPKGQALDWIIQKATELGAAEIVPVVTARVIARPEPGRAEDKRARWRKIAVEAARQCGAAWAPEVGAPAAFGAALASAGASRALMASLSPRAAPLREVLRAGEPPGAGGVAVWIGPEGDFTPEETDAAERAGVALFSLGARVLRVETAALAALSILQYEWGGREEDGPLSPR